MWYVIRFRSFVRFNCLPALPHFSHRLLSLATGRRVAQCVCVSISCQWQFVYRTNKASVNESQWIVLFHLHAAVIIRLFMGYRPTLKYRFVFDSSRRTRAQGCAILEKMSLRNKRARASVHRTLSFSWISSDISISGYRLLVYVHCQLIYNFFRSLLHFYFELE